MLREVLTFDVQRAQGECELSPSQIYARYVLRCKEYGKEPLALAWFGRLAKPLLREIHGVEPFIKHRGRGWRNVILRPYKPAKAEKVAAVAEPVTAGGGE